MITGHYKIANLVVSTETTLSYFENKEGLNDNLKRLDIVVECSVLLDNADFKDDNGINLTFVVENKIYSEEGNHGGRTQTEIYNECLQRYCDKYKRELIEVFLTPNEGQEPKCISFIKLTYQQLLDAVIFPLSQISMDEHSKMLITDYIRNLGNPAFNVQEDKVNANIESSILATSIEEVTKLNALFKINGFETLLKSAIFAKYEASKLYNTDKDVKTILCQITSEENELLTEFWDANENILKAVIRNCNLFKQEEIAFIFKNSNRDNSKYRVKLDGKYIFPDKPALSKGMTALAIFHAYAKKHNIQKVEDLRKAFPCDKLNSYYYRNYYKNLFYEYASTLKYDSDNKSHKGKEANATLDFYIKEYQLIDMGNEKAMAVFLWRKDDFNKLKSYVEANSELFKGIEIEQVVL